MLAPIVNRDPGDETDYDPDLRFLIDAEELDRRLDQARREGYAEGYADGEADCEADFAGLV